MSMAPGQDPEGFPMPDGCYYTEDASRAPSGMSGVAPGRNEPQLQREAAGSSGSTFLREVGV